MTTIKTASVKVMLSYDYSHFESSMTLESDIGVTKNEMDEARKDCQRLCDKAISQYKKMKELAGKRTDGVYQMANFEVECRKIEGKNEEDRTIKELAMLKEYKDQKWRDKFLYDYDYEDEDQQNN